MSEPTTTPETPVVPEATTDTTTGSPAGVKDRVVMASRHADGTPAQSEDFVFIGDKDDALKGAEHQLTSAAYAALQTSTDPDVNPTVEEQDAVRPAAEAKAKAEVDERHEDTQA